MRSHRAAVAVAVALYLAVFVLRLSVGGPIEATTMLYSLPIALLALTFGRRVGLLAGVVAFGLVGAWVAIADITFSPLAWASRAVPMLLLGWLIGDAADRLRASEDERRRLDEAAHWHRRAVEINDSIVQGLAVAKWSLEAGDTDGALEIVEDTLGTAHTLVSDLLRDADMAPGGEHAPGRAMGGAPGGRRDSAAG